MTIFRRGVHELKRLLAEHTFDLRALDAAGLRQWLGRHTAHWESDPAFVQRVRIREVCRAHPELQVLEGEVALAVAADEASPQHGRLHWLEQELRDTARALSGLAEAIQQAAPDRKPALQQKLDGFQSRRAAAADEQTQLIGLSPSRQARLRIEAELARLRLAAGLDREEALLADLLQQQGRRAGRAGKSFEQLARRLTESLLAPELARRHGRGPALPVRVLGGVTLGAAGTELDQVVVRTPRRRESPVEVLAVVEVKRNLNDLARGFRQRQGNLAWLTGDAASYDPARYRTRHFPAGHFDRVTAHHEQGETFLFDRSSFRRFDRDAASGWFLDRLYFVTRQGTLWGMGASALARIRHRAATDMHWNPDDEAYLARLLDWCRSLCQPLETPELLAVYALAQPLGRRILLAGR